MIPQPRGRGLRDLRANAWIEDIAQSGSSTTHALSSAACSSSSSPVSRQPRPLPPDPLVSSQAWKDPAPLRSGLLAAPSDSHLRRFSSSPPSISSHYLTISPKLSSGVLQFSANEKIEIAPGKKLRRFRFCCLFYERSCC